MKCEYDGTALTYDALGREEACEACASDIDLHLSRCRNCRKAPHLPERVTASVEEMAALFEA